MSDTVDEPSIAEKQEALQTGVDGVNSRLDRMEQIISNAVIVPEEKEEDASEDVEDKVAIKLKRSEYDSLIDEMKKLSGIAKNLVSGIDELKKNISTHDTKLADVEPKMLMKNNDLDQHFRLHNSIFHNMRGSGEGAKYCQDIANQLNYMLPNLSIPVTLHNIDIKMPHFF